ncbi:MAG: carbohydrate ABC transporter permease [Lachnospiraceae bacterium]|nr:carbohydrate ABC transporter permease [Lachnospiraceae bacterium]
MFFSGGMIPTYLVMTKLNLLNTRAAVILPGLVQVFNFIIMRTHFESIPDSLEESAYLDGGNDWQIFWKIAIPLSKSNLAMMVLFYGVHHWSSWFNEMLYLRDRAMWPLALITREIIINSSTGLAADSGLMTMEMADNIKYCTIIVTTLPILVLYPYLQKYFVKGQMTGAVKG